jgi:hypothetical protein
MIAEFSALKWLRVDEDGAMLFEAKAGTYQVDGGVPEILKGEDVTVRYSAEKWDALRLRIVEEDETTVVVTGDTGPRFSFPRGLPPCFPMKLH